MIDVEALSVIGKIATGKSPRAFGQFIQPQSPISWTAASARSWRTVRSRRKWSAMLTFISLTLVKPKILKFY